MVHLTTFGGEFYGFHVGKYTSHTWILWVFLALLSGAEPQDVHRLVEDCKREF